MSGPGRRAPTRVVASLHAAVLAFTLLGAPATAQNGIDLQQGVRTGTGSLLRVSTEALTFDFGADAIGSRDPDTAHPATHGSPFRLRAAVPSAAAWVLEVDVEVPIEAESAAPLSTLVLELRTVATGPESVPGCTGSGGWIPVDAPRLLLDLRGPGECALDVHARLRGPALEAPGRYQGRLTWTLRRAAE